MINVDELKTGDKVGVSGGGWSCMCVIRTVAKRTATQVVLDDGTRWTRSGRKVGEAGSYYRQFLLPEKEALERNAEEATKNKRLRLIASVRDLNFKDIADEGLLLILQIAADHKL